MMRIFLVRHGESEANVDRSVLLKKPDHAIGLSDLGKRQALEAGAFVRSWCEKQAKPHVYEGSQGSVSIAPPVPTFRIWYSPYARAAQTASIIHESLQGTPFVHDIREHILLCEQQFGLFDGHPDEDLPKLFPMEHEHYRKHEEFEGRFWARMPLGESRFDVAKRVHQAFGTFHRDAERHGIKDIMVVCHGVTMRAFVMMWCHKTVEWFEKERNPQNCAIRLIEDGEDRGYLHKGPREVVT
jgi:2,3-bisphosphoglycerate-dependent phosphoglycerate mutase